MKDRQDETIEVSLLEQYHQEFVRRLREREMVEALGAVRQRQEEIPQLAERGAKDLSKRREQARAATQVREAHRFDWRPKAKKTNAQLLEEDVGLSLRSRARIIGERVGKAPRTVEDFLRTLR